MQKEHKNVQYVTGGSNQDFCICCGKPIPEGRMVCYHCEMLTSDIDVKNMKNFENTY